MFGTTVGSVLLLTLVGCAAAVNEPAYFDKREYIEIIENDYKAGTCPACKRDGKKAEVFCGDIKLMSSAFCGYGHYKNGKYQPPICPIGVTQGCYCSNEHRWNVRGNR